MADDGLKSQATEMVKKILTIGVGTLFLTEEALRALISEFKLPKEIISSILDSANKTRREFMNNLSNDVIDRISKQVDPRKVMEEFLNRNELKFEIKLDISPKKKG